MALCKNSSETVLSERAVSSYSEINEHHRTDADDSSFTGDSRRFPHRKVHKGTLKALGKKSGTNTSDQTLKVAERPHPGLRLFSRCFPTRASPSRDQVWIKVSQNNCSSASLGLKAFKRTRQCGFPRRSVFTLLVWIWLCLVGRRAVLQFVKLSGLIWLSLL